MSSIKFTVVQAYKSSTMERDFDAKIVKGVCGRGSQRLAILNITFLDIF